MSNEAPRSSERIFARIIQFGHDLFAAENYETTARIAVNRSHALLNFRSATLFELQAGIKLLAQFGQTQIHPQAAVPTAQKNWLATQDHAPGHRQFTTSELPRELAFEQANYLVLNLAPPNTPTAHWAWLVEFDHPITPGEINTACLLGTSIAEALNCKRALDAAPRPKFLKRRNLWFLMVGILLAGLLCFPVAQQVNAEFTLVPEHISGGYAPFDGTLDKVRFSAGSYVTRGTPILHYDPAPFAFNLAEAQSARREAEQKLELVRQNSFSDPEQLGQIPLLQAQCRTRQIAESAAQWYVDHLTLTAPHSGTIVYTVPHAEQLDGKTVRLGEKLFEILSGQTIQAEIMVPENQSSILNAPFELAMYLYTAPETAIAGQVQYVSCFPQLNGNNRYCFVVRAQLAGDRSQLRYGMRGVAQLKGRKIALGYIWFKSLILYFRNW